jgi:hypothetical protein
MGGRLPKMRGDGLRRRIESFAYAGEHALMWMIVYLVLVVVVVVVVALILMIVAGLEYRRSCQYIWQCGCVLFIVSQIWHYP